MPLGGTETRRCTVTLLAVHAADAYEVEGDGSFRARRHTRLLRCAGVPPALSHDVLLSASVQQEYRSSDVLALVAVYQLSEEIRSHVLRRERARLGP
jgi:hypothetical protein